jgi:tetratricopeptide (TPR) repeat protein
MVSPTVSLADLQTWLKLPPEARFEKALELYRAKQMVPAIELFVTALQEQPALTMAPDDGLYPEVDRYYNAKVVSQGSKNPLDHFRLGWCHELKREHKAAQACYENALKLNPEARLAQTIQERMHYLDPLVAQEVSQSAKSLGLDNDAIIDDIRKGQHETMKPSEYLSQGRANYTNWITTRSQKELQLADAYLSGAVVKDPNNDECHFYWALVLWEKAKLGDNDARARAREQLQIALKLNPEPQRKLDIENLLKNASLADPKEAKK